MPWTSQLCFFAKQIPGFPLRYELVMMQHVLRSGDRSLEIYEWEYPEKRINMEMKYCTARKYSIHFDQSLSVSEKLHTYSSPNPTLTTTCYRGRGRYKVAQILTLVHNNLSKSYKNYLCVNRRDSPDGNMKYTLMAL